MMKVFTIIVTYNGMQWIAKCLQSVVGQSEIIVVDNHSSDETVSWIQDNFPEVVVLPQFENLGFGKANNIGISYALKQGAEAVFLLNQDAFAQPNCVKNLVITSMNNPEYGIISPIHFNADGSEIDYSFLKFTAPFLASGLISDLITNNFRKEIYDVAFINAAAWLIPIKTLKTVGGFDPIFFMYGEDDNYCQRVLYHGFKIGIIPNSEIYHDSKNNSHKTLIENTSEYYNRFLAESLVKYANVNTFEKRKLFRYKLYLLRKMVINLFVFNVKVANLFIKKFKRIDTNLIKKSVKINRIAMPNYLN